MAALAPLDATVLDTRRPFTRADAVAAGIDPNALRGKRFRRLFKGVYISSSVPHSPLHRIQGALAVHPPSAFASHLSAARLYGLPVPHHADEHVSVFHENDRRRRPGIRCHVAPRDTDVGLREGLRVSEPVPMFIELAALLSLVDLTVVGDAMVRRGMVLPSALVAACRTSSHPHAAAALRSALLVRAGVDSPMETRLRLLLVLAGLPEPTVDHRIHDEAGNVLRRFDLAYPGFRLVVEYDGRQHAEDVDQYESDIHRREELDRWKWRVVVVTAKGIYQRPEETLLRVRTALLDQGATGLRSGFDDEWRFHFPTRAPLRRTS